MIEGTISIRYARALMGLATEDNQVDAFGKQLKKFLDCCRVYPDLLITLSAKGLNLLNRENIINDLAEKFDFHTHVKNFLKILLDKGRIDLIATIYEEYVEMANQALNRCPMTITSAVDLPGEQYGDLVEYFSQQNQKEMILNKEIDPEVLGGLRVRIGDVIYDYTLRKQLNELKKNMMA